MTPNERNAPIPANRVIDEPWRTAVTDKNNELPKGGEACEHGGP